MKQKKSILFLARLYHPHIGGVENHVRTLSHELIKKGFNITVLTERFKTNLMEEEVIDGVRVVRISIPKSSLLKKFYIWKWVVLNTAFFSKFEIIHVHDVFYWLYPLIPFGYYKKMTITFHGYEGFPVKKSWIIQRKIAEFMTKGSICVGDFMKKWYFANPTHVTYGGVRLARKNKRVNSQSAVFFGRLDDQTGILQYIKAYKIIKNKYPEFKLTVVGEGRLSSKVPGGVKTLGFQDDVEDLIASSRFVFVSRYLSMLEALVQKKEVIAVYNTPIMKDYLEMSPFKKYIQIAKDEKEIAHFVEKSLDKGPAINKIKEGYGWASKQTWGKIQDIYEKLWS